MTQNDPQGLKYKPNTVDQMVEREYSVTPVRPSLSKMALAI